MKSMEEVSKSFVLREIVPISQKLKRLKNNYYMKRELIIIPLISLM